jgi:hypothetical protein
LVVRRWSSAGADDGSGKKKLKASSQELIYAN